MLSKHQYGSQWQASVCADCSWVESGVSLYLLAWPPNPGRQYHCDLLISSQAKMLFVVAQPRVQLPYRCAPVTDMSSPERVTAYVAHGFAAVPARHRTGFRLASLSLSPSPPTARVVGCFFGIGSSCPRPSTVCPFHKSYIHTAAPTSKARPRATAASISIWSQQRVYVSTCLRTSPSHYQQSKSHASVSVLHPLDWFLIYTVLDKEKELPSTGAPLPRVSRRRTCSSFCLDVSTSHSIRPTHIRAVRPVCRTGPGKRGPVLLWLPHASLAQQELVLGRRLIDHV
jgi:hypothetical protein